jgi:hypothetical protein
LVGCDTGGACSRAGWHDPGKAGHASRSRKQSRLSPFRPLISKLGEMGEHQIAHSLGCGQG